MPAKMPAEQRKRTVIQIRATDEEVKQCEAKAAEEGFKNVADWVRARLGLR